MKRKILENEKIRNIRVALDCDDVLFSCNQYAIDMANKEKNFNPKLQLHELIKWGKQMNRADAIFEYYSRADFYQSQPVLKGAKEFVKKLCEIADVYIITATSPEFMSERALRILKEFPEINPNNILLGACKNICKVDFLLDDGAHNITKSIATYPILFRRPWNRDMTGCLSVNSYDDFLKIIDILTTKPNSFCMDKVRFVNLIGPTGSGKNKICNILCEMGFVRPNVVTTKTSKPFYRNINIDEYYQLLENDMLIESSMYAGEHYGLEKEVIDETKGFLVMPIDICGAIAMKEKYGDEVLNVFIKRDKKMILKEIRHSNLSDEEFSLRILSLKDEEKNEMLCDICFENNAISYEELKIDFLKFFNSLL